MNFRILKRNRIWDYFYTSPDRGKGTKLRLTCSFPNTKKYHESYRCETTNGGVGHATKPTKKRRAPNVEHPHSNDDAGAGTSDNLNELEILAEKHQKKSMVCKSLGVSRLGYVSDSMLVFWVSLWINSDKWWIFQPVSLKEARQVRAMLQDHLSTLRSGQCQGRP